MSLSKKLSYLVYKIVNLFVIKAHRKYIFGEVLFSKHNVNLNLLLVYYSTFHIELHILAIGCFSQN